MKFIAKILLTVLFLPVFVLFVVSINIRSQFLSYNFWTNTFEKGNVYSQISGPISDRLISKVVASGSKKSDVALLSSLISPGSLKNFFEQNLDSFLKYVNGESSELIVVAPLSVQNLSKNSDLRNLGDLSQKMPLTDFLREYNISNFDGANIKTISQFGTWSWVFLIMSFSLLVFILILIYILVSPGKHLIAIGMPLSLSGILVLGMSYCGNLLSKIAVGKNSGGLNVGMDILAAAVPPVIHKIIQIWIWCGVASIFLGILLFFIKKPAFK